MTEPAVYQLVIDALNSQDVNRFKDVCKLLQSNQLELPAKSLQNHLDRFIDVCKACTTLRVKRADDSLFNALRELVTYFEDAYKELVKSKSKGEMPKSQRESLICLLKLCMSSQSHILVFSFSSVVNDFVPWKTLTKEEQLDILAAIVESLPRVVIDCQDETDGPVYQIHAAMYYNAVSHLLNLCKKTLDSDVQELLAKFVDVCANKCAVSPFDPHDEERLNAFGNLYLMVVANLGFKYVDFCVSIMSSLEKMSESKDGNLNAITNSCLQMVTAQRSSSIDSNTVQRKVDAFLKDSSGDTLGVTADMLLKAYVKDKELVHRNLEAMSAHIPTCPAQSAANIAKLLKEVSARHPEAVSDVVLGNAIKAAMIVPMATYFLMEMLQNMAKSRPQRIKVSDVVPLASASPMYTYQVCAVLKCLGTDPASPGAKVTELLSWLLSQTMNPMMYSYREVMLSTARAVGMSHQTVLTPFKGMIDHLNTDPTLRDQTAPILDILEGRSLATVAVKVEEQASQIGNVANELKDTKQDVSQVKVTIDQQSLLLTDVSTMVQKQEHEIKVIQAELAEAIIDIDRIDRKTIDTTPGWAHDIARLLNPPSDRDWRLLAKRLGYSNDDLKGWATQTDPCMSALVEWFCTHKTSEASRAVFIVLKDMGQDAAADIVRKAMDAAGELVPESEVLDLQNPPTVFISYQWSVQEKAKRIHDFLKSAGFRCWMDIGQMGGGDKLYEKIDTGIRSAKLIISLVTAKYAQSPNCNKEVNLSVALQKPLIPLLMEQMSWPPEGGMGPIFGEYLFIRFFQRDGEKKDGIFWPEAKMEELLMQMRANVEPEDKLVSKEMDDWWCSKTGRRIKPLPGENSKTPISVPEIFISYQWGKQKEVALLYKKLTSLGYTCWLDIHQMGGGDSLYDQIDRGIRGCKVVLSCVTEKYSISQNCRREVSLADSLGTPILPLLLEKMQWPPAGSMSMPFSQLQYLDFTRGEVVWEGNSFSLLLLLLAQNGVVKTGSISKAVSSLGTTMKAVSRMKRGKKSRACSLM